MSENSKSVYKLKTLEKSYTISSSSVTQGVNFDQQWPAICTLATRLKAPTHYPWLHQFLIDYSAI